MIPGWKWYVPYCGMASCEQAVSPISNPSNNPDDICRAYYKLSEAFERYQPNGFQLKDRKVGTNSQRPTIIESIEVQWQQNTLL